MVTFSIRGMIPAGKNHKKRKSGNPSEIPAKFPRNLCSHLPRIAERCPTAAVRPRGAIRGGGPGGVGGEFAAGAG